MLSMNQLSNLIAEFVETIRSGQTEIYNEFSLQHELGIFLRQKIPASKVQFERNVTHFFPSTKAGTIRQRWCPRTMDLEKGGRYAILMPRNKPIWKMSDLFGISVEWL